MHKHNKQGRFSLRFQGLIFNAAFIANKEVPLNKKLADSIKNQILDIGRYSSHQCN